MEAEPAIGDLTALSDIIEGIVADVPDLPGLMTTELTADNFTYYTFATMSDGAEGLVSEPMIGSIPFSAVLVRAADADAAAALAKEMEANMDLRKWICVEAEKGIVTVHGSTVLMVMASTDAADAITANFDALWA